LLFFALTQDLNITHASYFLVNTGTSANNQHFQAYLTEGVHRWNCDRAAATKAERPTHTSYASADEVTINKKNEQLFGTMINPSLVAPIDYTGNIEGIQIRFELL